MEPGRPRPRPTVHEWLWLVAGLALVFRYRWLMDDAFVYFRYVDNWLFAGAGLVFNDGEYVEGFSSPAQTLVLAALRALHLDWMNAVLVLGAACYVGFWWLLVVLNRELGSGRAVFNLPLAVLALNYGTTSFFTSGLETPLAHLVAPALALALWRPVGGGVALLVACAPLVRPELALALAGTLAFVAWRDRRFPTRLFVFATLVNVGWLGFRVVYYADLLPNTYYLKDDVQLSLGLLYAWDLLRSYHLLWLGAALAALVAFAARRGEHEPARPPGVPARIAMVALSLAVAGYVVKVGGTSLHYWYLAFAFSLLVCASAGLVEWALARLGLDERPPMPWAAVACALSLLVGAAHPRQLAAHPLWRASRPTPVGVISDAAFHRLHPTLQPASWRETVRIEDLRRAGSERAERGYAAVITGTWCREHWARSDSRVVHAFGLTEPILARVRAAELLPGHKPALRPLAADLAKLRRRHGVGRGATRRAVAAGDAADWIARNLEAIEQIERKLHNRHDPWENLDLALQRIDPLETR